jgi:hypothetical protein
MNMKRAMGWMVALATGVTACDPGGKSVTETAEGSESEGESSSEEGGSISSTSIGESGTTATTTGADPSMTGGSESGDIPDVPACLETVTDVGADEQTPLGFSGAQVLLETIEFDQTFMLSDDTGPIVIEGAGIETALALSIQPGPSHYVESVENPEYVDFNPQGCQSRLEMDVTVRFDTADGRFAEVLDEAVLVAYEVSSFTWSERIAPDGFMGTFSEADISYENATGVIDYFDLQGTVAGGESTGSLWGSGTLDPDELDEDVGYGGLFGSWPVE